MGPPVNYANLEKLLPKMEKFLDDNKQALYQMMNKNGWFIGGPFSITAEFNTAITEIKGYLHHGGTGTLDLLNESITQLHYYLTHKP